MKSCLEAKLFGIGLEAYTVGSHDFYAGYCAKNNVMYTLDTGHYEPTENVSDAVSALLLFVPELMLHVSRPMHWDSDHVTLFDAIHATSSQSWFVPTHSTVLTSVSTTSTVLSTASVLTSSVYVQPRSHCCRHSLSHSIPSASTRTRASSSSVWLSSRKRRHCHSVQYMITST